MKVVAPEVWLCATWPLQTSASADMGDKVTSICSFISSSSYFFFLLFSVRRPEGDGSRSPVTRYDYTHNEST